MKKTPFIIISIFALLILLGIIFTTKNDRKNIYNKITSAVIPVSTNKLAKDGVYTLSSFNNDLVSENITLALEGENIGVTFCNIGGGNYSLQENIIKADITITEMACDSKDLMEMESLFTQELHKGMIFSYEENILSLQSQEGGDIFVFEYGNPEPVFDGNDSSAVTQ
ncbi:MAG: META domain-containing protein [Candidatus Pacebacteria bacterium]|nr:META domain-containing protein [Candidatus Paceibacterota bacterium]